MHGDRLVRFLGEAAAATSLPYPTTTVMGGHLTCGGMKNLVGMTPFDYCYAENHLKSV
jgi:hypothetical protein